MSRSTSATVVMALLLWMCAPALACLVPAEKLNPAEMKCCHEMAGDCGGMAMAEHSCCPRIPAKVQSDKKVMATVARYLAPALAMHSLTPQLAIPYTAAAWSPPLIAPLAESPPGGTLPLRI